MQRRDGRKGVAWLASLSGLVTCAAFAHALTGCPDAIRALPPETIDDAGAPMAADGAPPLSRVPDGGTGPSRERLGDVTGQIAVGGQEVFVNTGTSLLALAKSPGKARSVAALAGGRAVAVDGSRVFYTQSKSYVDLYGSLYSGSELHQFGFSLAAEPELAGDGSALYWVDSHHGSVSRADLAVGGTGDLWNSPEAAVHLALTEHDVVLVLAPRSEGIQRVIARPKSESDHGTDSVDLGSSRGVLWLVADHEAAFWMEEGLGIRAATVEGNGPAPMGVSGDPSWFDLGAATLDATHVYWASHALGRVFRASRTSGVAEPFASGFVFPVQRSGAARPLDEPQRALLGTDESFLYVSDDTGVYRIAK